MILLSFLWKDPYICHCLICSTDTILKLDIYVEYHVSIMIAQKFANFFNIHWKYDVIKKYDVIDTIICWGQHFKTYYISNESTLQDKSFDVCYNEIGPQTTDNHVLLFLCLTCFQIWSSVGHVLQFLKIILSYSESQINFRKSQWIPGRWRSSPGSSIQRYTRGRKTPPRSK